MAELMLGLMERFHYGSLKQLRAESAELWQMVQIEQLGREEL